MREQGNPNKLKLFLRRISRYKRVIIILSLLFLIFLLSRSDLISKSSKIFPIKEVRIENMHGDSPQYIAEQNLSESIKYAKENNYISLNTGVLATKIKEESPFAKELIITKSLPGNVTVSIRERDPILGLEIGSYGCVVIDKVGYVLEKTEKISEAEEETVDCIEQFSKYKIPKLSIEDTKTSFTVNEQSAFYIIEDLHKILLTTSHYNLDITEMNLKDNVLTAKTSSEKELVFSMNQPIEEQLKRFISVIGQISQDVIEFTHIDLRYKRPVVRQK